MQVLFGNQFVTGVAYLCPVWHILKRCTVNKTHIPHNYNLDYSKYVPI